MTRNARSHIDDLRGASRLAVEATRGVTALVERMHTVIASGPASLGQPLAAPARLVTGLVYATIQGITAAGRHQPRRGARAARAAGDGERPGRAARGS